MLIFVIIDKGIVLIYIEYMIPEERRQQLVTLLKREPGLAVPDLATRLEVSPGTIRNDLRALADAGQVVRVRGGGTVLTDPQSLPGTSFSERARRNERAKQCIARCAAEMVQDGDSILLDASTSVYHLARFLKNRHNLRIVTNGVEVARLLAQNPTHQVLLVGGTLRASTQSLSGPWSLRYLEEVYTRLAFVSCSGFTPHGGMTEVDLLEAEFRVKAISVTTQVIALIDSSKYGMIDLSPSIKIDRITHIYTDRNLSSDWVEQLHDSGIPFTLCE